MRFAIRARPGQMKPWGVRLVSFLARAGTGTPRKIESSLLVPTRPLSLSGIRTCMHPCLIRQRPSRTLQKVDIQGYLAQKKPPPP